MRAREVVSSTPFSADVVQIEIGVFGVEVMDGARRAEHGGMTSRMSIPCQNRCEGSMFAPTMPPTASRRRRQVAGLYTQETGVQFERDLFHAVVGGELRRPPSNTGMSTFSHCQFRTS